MIEPAPENLHIDSPEKALANLLDGIKTLEILANPEREKENLDALRKKDFPSKI